MTNNDDWFIVFKLNQDPYGLKPISVHGERFLAEDAKLLAQQKEAFTWNNHRLKAFGDGGQFGAMKTASDFDNIFSITQVSQGSEVTQ